MGTRIGFIGLGNMGEPMALNLARRGYDVVAFDREAERRQALADLGLAVAEHVPGAAAPIVILMLPNGSVVKDVLTGDAGLVDHLPDDATVIDMSSVDPAVYGEIEQLLQGHQVHLVDAPVSGNVTGAEAGTLTIIAGGAYSHVERVRPVLEAMGKTVFHTGGLGTGQTAKALNNLMSAGGLILAIEALLVGRSSGLDPRQFVEIVNLSTGRNNSTERKIERFVLSRSFDSGFGLSLMAKDLRTAAAIAERAGIAIPLSQAAITIAQAADAALGPGADHTAVARWIEAETGVTIS